MLLKEKKSFLRMNRGQLMIAIGTGLAALLALFLLRFVHFDNDIGVMLPRQPEILRTFQFFREAPFARSAVVSFELKEGAGETSDLLSAVDRFAAKVDSPMITRVFTGVDARQSFEDMREFVRLAPQLMDARQLEAVEDKLNGPAVKEKLEAFYRVSLSPGGAFLTPLLRRDPLGLQTGALQDLKSLMQNSDYDVRLQDGYLLSRDGRRALVVLETAVPVTDGFGAAKLAAYLEGLLAELPPAVSADLIAGHKHSISNERVIKRDILVTTSVTSVVFLLLFLFLFKDLRAVLLFVTPAVSVLVSIPLCAWISGELSYIILGMGAVISGIAVDYCIHVYVAMQSGQTRKDALREIAKPVIIGALTTAGVFAVFLFSNVPGNRQLALFTIVSTFISLGLSLLIFPHFLTPSAPPSRSEGKILSRRIPDYVVMGLWAVLLAACAAAVPLVHFKMDVRQYDGSERSIFDAEEKFHRDWGRQGKQAMLVVEAKSFDEALAASERLRPEILSALGSEERYTGLSRIWPAEQTRNERREKWNGFWKEGRAEKLRALLVEQGSEYGFSEDAFEPFFKGLTLEAGEVKTFEQIPLLQQLRKRFSFKTEKGYQLIHYFPEEEKLVEAVSRQIEGRPEAFVVSAKRFEALLSHSTQSEAVYLSFAIALILPLLSFLFLKNLRLVLISLIPVLSSVLFIFGMLAALNLPLNVSSVIALLVVGGFSIDYGIFMMHKIESNLKTDTYRAVTISALTIFLGAGALVFARHPVLFSYGSTMVFGIAAGYVSAVLVVPAFCRLGAKKQVQEEVLQHA